MFLFLVVFQNIKKCFCVFVCFFFFSPTGWVSTTLVPPPPAPRIFFPVGGAPPRFFPRAPPFFFYFLGAPPPPPPPHHSLDKGQTMAWWVIGDLCKQIPILASSTVWDSDQKRRGLNLWPFPCLLTYQPFTDVWRAASPVRFHSTLRNRQHVPTFWQSREDSSVLCWKPQTNMACFITQTKPLATAYTMKAQKMLIVLNSDQHSGQSYG